IHLTHQQSYQPPQETYPLYYRRRQDISIDNGYQGIPDVQRRQSIPQYYTTLTQQIEEYEKIRKLLDELRYCNKVVPDPEIERLNREIESLRLQVEKTTSIKESPVKEKIADIEPLDGTRREKNLEIKNIVKKTQDNIRDYPSSFSSPTDNKFLEEKEKKEKKIKAWESYYNTKLELMRYEWEVKHGNPIVDAFLVGGLNLILQIGEALGNKPKKQEINPPPKRVTLIPFKEKG
ncbi:MAG: hypothetical protein MUO82_00530, partial [Candidatus Thermoplasmatota archaeon]|nr:hypothetical protein [Candidatus Thermoplasmatota archaeon]